MTQIKEITRIRDLILDDEAVGHWSTLRPFEDMHPMTLQEGLRDILDEVEAVLKREDES